MKLSTHIAIEREERLVQIATTIGFGTIVDTFYRKEKSGEVRCYCVSDTGVLFIKDKRQQVLITAYAAHANKIASLYKDYGRTVPSYLFKIAMNNEKKRAYLFKQALDKSNKVCYNI